MRTHPKPYCCTFNHRFVDRWLLQIASPGLSVANATTTKAGAGSDRAGNRITSGGVGRAQLPVFKRHAVFASSSLVSATYSCMVMPTFDTPYLSLVFCKTVERTITRFTTITIVVCVCVLACVCVCVAGGGSNQ